MLLGILKMKYFLLQSVTQKNMGLAVVCDTVIWRYLFVKLLEKKLYQY